MTYLKQKDETIRTAEGKWLNSDVFRQEAIRFMKNGHYINDPMGSPAWLEYWTKQLTRCIFGYEVGGHKITGDHYEYLNFTQIQVVIQVEGSKVSKKITKMPDFWDGDYDYYWSVEIAKNGLYSENTLVQSTEEERTNFYILQAKLDELLRVDSNADKSADYIVTKEDRDKISIGILDRLQLKVQPHLDWLDGGHHIIVGKSRRKGYSYKNAAKCANRYNTIRKSLCLIGAFDKSYLYPKGTMDMASKYLSFFNKHTGWGKARELTDKVDIKTASFVEIDPVSNIKSEVGYLSTIQAITFGDNPDAARGKDAIEVLLEEGGKFPNLKASYQATEPGLTAGKYITGQITIFGTGGDMEHGTIDFADMFYHPMEYNLMPFVNIWDENATNSYCGFFHPVYLNMEGHYDSQGNSDTEGAIAEEKATRDKIRKNATSSAVLQKRVQEWPLSPSEAFLTVSINDFPIIELRNQYNKVIRENLHLKLGQPVYLERIEQKKEEEDKPPILFGDGSEVIPRAKVRAVPDLTGDLIQPLWDYKPKTNDLKGGVVIYEYPITNAPRGLYKIGFDPYRQASSTATLPSLAAIYVYKSVHRGSFTRNMIVAQYIGRPYDPNDVNRIAEMLCELYNAELMYENEVTHVKDYFVRKNKLHLLALQPQSVIDKAVGNSRVKRKYGMHMHEKIKDAGEKYIKQWLLQERDYDENGKPELNLAYIYDPALLDELILYNRKGNFDRVMAFMMVMFQIEEDDEGTEYNEEEKDSTGDDLLELMQNQFRKN